MSSRHWVSNIAVRAGLGLVCLLTSLSALAAGRTVTQIQVVGLKRIEPDAVISKMTTKKGQALDSETISQDIRALYSMGYFDNIEVLSDDQAGGVALTVKIKERPVIAELQFEGNEKIDTDDLKEVVKSKEWSILDINRVREDTQAIQKHYEDKGFFLSKASYDVVQIKDDEYRVIFHVRDYEKVQIKKITFLNNRHFTDAQLKAVLHDTQEGSMWSFMSGSGSYKDAAFKMDLQRLTYWYLENGYVKFRYENPVVTVSDDKRWMYISIYVDEGEQYSIGEVDFGGELLFPKDELSKEVQLNSGKTFKISTRNEDIQRLTEKYQDLGYAFVNVIPKMEFRDETKTIDLEYHFEKGSLVTVGNITVLGNTKTHDKVVRRELRIHEGELFNGTNYRVSRERVERLGFFQPGEVLFNMVTRKGRDDIVDIEITIKERSTGTITLGMGYGSVQKFFIQTQIQEINLFGRGQQISLQGSYAADQISQNLNLSFTDPYAFDTIWSLGGDLFWTQFPIPGRYNLRKLGFNARAGYPLNDDITFYVTYKNEGSKILQVTDPDTDVALEEGVLSSLVFSVVRDKRNNRFEPTNGDYQNVQLETAGVGGDKRFIKWTANHRWYRPVVGDLVFRNSIEIGHIIPMGGSGTPTSTLFYLGGPNNMKGWLPFTLGPTRVNSSGNTVPIGGKAEAFALFEFEYPLIREAGIKFVTFFDAGNAFADFPGVNGTPFQIYADAGLGFRWFSPIGPLRFEWGFPLNRRPQDDTQVFNFYIGPSF